MKKFALLLMVCSAVMFTTIGCGKTGSKKSSSKTDSAKTTT